MIDEKEIKEAEKNIPRYLSDNMLMKHENNKQYVNFYKDTATMSFQVAQHLYTLSTDKELKKKCGFNEDFECFLWVLVPAYYGMFYIANAALSKIGIKVGDKIPHKVTQDALIVYLLQNKKLAKKLLEFYVEAKSEVLNVMNITEDELLKRFEMKANELIATFEYQRKKRGEFQYAIQSPTKQQIAKTSMERAKTFIQEINSILDKL